MNMIKIVAEGGHYWPKRQLEGVHSICVANGSAFKIAMAGTDSRVYTTGVVRDGWHVVSDGPHHGRRFASANAVVVSVRQIDTDAFLYMSYAIGGAWHQADDMRRDPAFAVDPAEELALADALKILAKRMSKSTRSPATIRDAARFVLAHPEMVQSARRIVSLPRPDIRVDPATGRLRLVMPLRSDDEQKG